MDSPEWGDCSALGASFHPVAASGRGRGGWEGKGKEGGGLLWNPAGVPKKSPSPLPTYTPLEAEREGESSKHGACGQTRDYVNLGYSRQYRISHLSGIVWMPVQTSSMVEVAVVVPPAPRVIATPATPHLPLSPGPPHQPQAERQSTAAISVRAHPCATARPIPDS